MSTLLSVLEKVKIRGDILLGKVYGYTDQYSDLKEVLLSNTFTVVPSLRYGISQKNNADILLVIDALQYRPHVSHLSLSEALDWVERLRPSRAVLTHMHVPLDYATVMAETPDNVMPAYDGMTFEFPMITV